MGTRLAFKVGGGLWYDVSRYLFFDKRVDCKRGVVARLYVCECVCAFEYGEILFDTYMRTGAYI